MNTIYFVTSNKGKVRSLQEHFDKKFININVKGIDLNISEPQAYTVKEVSLIKAKKAFEQIQAPVIVEDGGFCIDALNGFPGVYTKYALETIGADGILDLMLDKDDRNCGFVSCTTFIDEKGNIHQFDRSGGRGQLVKEKSSIKSEMAWSDLWYIFHVPELNKILCEATKEEVLKWWASDGQKSSVTNFVEWFKDNY